MKNNPSIAKNKIVCSLLRRSILELCKSSIPETEGVEVDAILCITLGKNTEEQIVVKIHETLWDNLAHGGYPQQHHVKYIEQTQQKKIIHDDNMVSYPSRTTPLLNQSLTSKKVNKRKSSFPLPISSAKQPCLEVESEFGDPLETIDVFPELKKEVLDDTVEKGTNNSTDNECNIYGATATSYKTNDESFNDTARPGFDDQPPEPICIEPSEMYVCDVCKQCFNTYNSYTKHMQTTQHCKVINICRYCNRKFTNFNSFVFHMRSHGAQETTGDFWKGKPLRCGVCTVVLRSKRGVVDHMRSEHQYVKCYTCTTCEEIYPDFNSFCSHRRQIHSNINQCRCDMCELFFTFTEFKDHEKECMIKIHFDSSRKQHPSISRNVYQPSGQSNTLLMTGEHVSENVTIVDESQPEVAAVVPLSPKADIVTTTSSKGVTGVQSGQSPIISPMEGPFRCQSCFSVFQEFEQYETHNHEMHSRFVCSYCAQSFATRRNLQRHARRHTGVRPYQCLDCDSNFTRDDDLKKHMFRMNHLTGYKAKALSPMVSRSTPVALPLKTNNDKLLGDIINASTQLWPNISAVKKENIEDTEVLTGNLGMSAGQLGSGPENDSDSSIQEHDNNVESLALDQCDSVKQGQTVSSTIEASDRLGDSVGDNQDIVCDARTGDDKSVVGGTESRIQCVSETTETVILNNEGTD